MIGAAIRKHDTNLGETRVSTNFGPSGDPRIACIKRRAADLIDANETIGGENPPSKIARFKALVTMDTEASVMWAAKAATRSGRRATRFVTCRLVAPTPRAEALLATPIARLDRAREGRKPSATAPSSAPARTSARRARPRPRAPGGGRRRRPAAALRQVAAHPSAPIAHQVDRNRGA